jgi:hypothetical protein
MSTCHLGRADETGRLDERFDAALVAALADSHPEWQVVLVGPVLMITPKMRAPLRTR